jgi:HEAT repeats
MDRARRLVLVSASTVQDPYNANRPNIDTGPSQPPPLPDLPPVEAPSAGFVVQLFVIPAVVVAVVILVWLLFGKLAGGERDPAEYVRRLRQASGDWRSAFELASLIQNDPKLASDPRLLGELTELLSAELKTNENTELKAYLIKTIGAFQTLDATLGDNRKVDPIEALTMALEPGRDSAIRMEAAASLAKHAARLEGKLDDPRAVAALAQAASGEEPELRQVAAYALGFFGGEPARKALRERLQTDENRFVRYNAAVALGRQGDPAAKATLKEMLSTADLDRVIDIRSTTEKQNKIEAIELEALQALQSSLSTGSSELVRSLRSEIEGLTQSGLVSIRSQAQSVLKQLQPGS